MLAIPDAVGSVVASGRAGSNPARPAVEWLRLSLCLALVALGISVMIGWVLDIEALKSVAPGLSTMKFNTALGFVICGTGIAAAGRRQALWRACGGTLGFCLAILGGATIVQYLWSIDLGIDQAFFVDHGILTGSGHPGRMSLLTALAWAGLGLAIALIAFAKHRREILVANGLTLLGGAVSVLAVAGYTFGAEEFWGIGQYTRIAVHTAAGLLLAAAAAMMTRAADGWLAPYVDSPAARALLARLLPLSLLVPVLLGMVIMFGAGLGAYNAPYGFALFIPLTCVTLVLASLWIADKQREGELVQLRYERHLQLVVAELNHRVKNTLSIVQSFAHQSLKGSATSEAAGAAFEGRLTALAAAHNLLSQENWDDIGLQEMVASALAAHRDSPGRFSIDGPDIQVTPKTAVTLAMTLHELATNSTKYGALAKPEGYVRIGWTVADDCFRFRWQECDGPACSPPEQASFGSKMLRRALANELGGKAQLNFEPDGLVYELDAPVRVPL